MKRKFVSIMMVLCMILPSFGGLSALALDIIDMGDNATLICDNPYNKIHFYFDNQENATIDDAAELQAATAAVKGDYAAALMAVDGESEVNENVYITVQFASDYMETNEYEVFKAALESATTPEMRDTVKTQRNTFSKNYHAAIIEENLPILADIPCTAVNAIDYSSFVTLTVPAAQLDVNVLAEVAENSSVLHLSLTDGFEVATDEDLESSSTATDGTYYSSWNEVLECIGARTIVENGTYTGEGVIIGIYEAHGIPNMNHENLDDISYGIRSGDENDIDNNHATKVASIVALMAPDATFYLAKRPEAVIGEYLEGIECFIDVGCDVVNCSFNYIKQSNSINDNHQYLTYRYDIDGLYDYQCRSSGIAVVKSTGNTNWDDYNPYITSPGYAYNVITVGGVEYSPTTGGWIHHQWARYQVSQGRAKPDISAPSAMYIPGFVNAEEGTSLSAPLVTASIALWLESVCTSYNYSVYSRVAKSVLLSTADKTSDYVAMSLGGLDEKVGAGIVNVQRMLQDNGVNIQLINNLADVNENGEIERSIHISVGVELQLALAWRVSSERIAVGQTGGSVQNANYNIYLYNSSGNLVASSELWDSSVEMFRYVTTSIDTYRLVIRPTATMSGDILALSYTFEYA